MLTFTPVYRSIAVMKIASYTPYIAYTSNEQPMNPEEFTETQIELLRSPLVMEQLLTKPEISELKNIQEEENPVGWLANRVRVDQVGNSELYYVYLDAPNPEMRHCWSIQFWTNTLPFASATRSRRPHESSNCSTRKKDSRRQDPATTRKDA